MGVRSRWRLSTNALVRPQKEGGTQHHGPNWCLPSRCQESISSMHGGSASSWISLSTSRLGLLPWTSRMMRRCRKSQMPPAPDATHVDRLLQRQAVLTARENAKTAADCTMEVSHVVQLTEALLEAEEVIEASTAARHHYLNVQKEHEDNLEQQGGHKRRATGSTRRSTPAPAAPPPIHMLLREGLPTLPRTVVDKVLGNLQHLPDTWPLIRFDLMLRKSASYYAIWRRFLHLSEYLRTFSPDTANVQLLMSMHEGLLSIWCSSWLSGSSWPWSLQG